jgi:hypothetical protein
MHFLSIQQNFLAFWTTSNNAVVVKCRQECGNWQELEYRAALYGAWIATVEDSSAVILPPKWQ